MVDDRTPNRQYPLPHPDNWLVDPAAPADPAGGDLGRIRAALAAIDDDIATVGQALTTALDSVAAGQTAFQARLDAQLADHTAAVTGITRRTSTQLALGTRLLDGPGLLKE